MRLEIETFENFLKKPVKERLSYYEKEERLYHIMRSQQFSLEFMEKLFDTADLIKFITRKPNGVEFLHALLKHKRAMLYFTQPSTRTFLSFLSACQIVGMSGGEVRDPSLSSEIKGETQEDGLRTISSYFDLIIMRDSKAGFSEYMAYLLDLTGRSVPIINGGSGKDQHPTQALLDVYTLHRSFQDRGGISGKTYGFVGDLLRGRAVRSVIYLLTRYSDLEMYIVAPPSLQIAPDLEEHLTENNVKIHKTDQLDEVLPYLDSLYMTRVQDEYDLSGESSIIDYSKFCLTPKNIGLMKKDAIILHPLPRRKEIDPVLDSDPRAMYWRQLRNGMYIRAALLLYLFKMEHRLVDY
ncbi:MAG: aspartate carbamoyltransferase [SAR324 cluster bacterium]|nr:aspartate carbamoyltransferase [SAR324 cluster bacterium]